MVLLAWIAGVLLLALVLLNITLTVLDDRATRAAQYESVTVQQARAAPKNTYRINDVVKANLFGDDAPKVVAVAPKTTLNLKLKGVLSANSATFARAIIQAGSKPSVLYAVGDNIKGAGANIEEIRQEEVLLNRAGAIESLPLVKLGDSKGASISFNSQATADTIEADTGLRQFAQAAARPLQADNNNAAQTKPNSSSGERRKIKRPNFSGLDRALKKMGEI